MDEGLVTFLELVSAVAFIGGAALFLASYPLAAWRAGRGHPNDEDQFILGLRWVAGGLAIVGLMAGGVLYWLQGGSTCPPC